MRERGVKNHRIVIADGLQGMPEAIGQVFPSAKHQRCMVRVQRNLSHPVNKECRSEIMEGFAEGYSQEPSKKTQPNSSGS